MKPDIRFNMKTTCLGTVFPLHKDKTVVRPIYLYDGNAITGRTTSLHWIIQYDWKDDIFTLSHPICPKTLHLRTADPLWGKFPVGRQLLYLLCWAEWSTTVNGYLRNKILFKRYTFSYDPTPATDVYPHNSRCQNCISLSHKGNIIFDIIILPICSCIRVT